MADNYMRVDEFTRAHDALREDIRSGFDGVNKRLDVLNGKTNRHAEALAGHEVRFQSITKDVESLQVPDRRRETDGGGDGLSSRRLGALGVVAVALVEIAGRLISVGLDSVLAHLK